MWGNHVVIPQKQHIHNIMVEELHRGHPGMAHMKAVAHAFLSSKSVSAPPPFY